MRRAALLLFAAAWAGCDRGGPEDPTSGGDARFGPSQAGGTGAGEAAPVKHYCPSCGAPAGPNHVCGLTFLCPDCRQDAASHHVCRRTIFCRDCRREANRVNHRCELTQPCLNPDCVHEGAFREAGPGHVCGTYGTQLCLVCKREVSALPDVHRCSPQTFFCAQCKWEVTETHVHGLSGFHPPCGQEATRNIDNHRCGETAFCPVCRAERSLPHHHD